jgi:hypothetical protein
MPTSKTAQFLAKNAHPAVRKIFGYFRATRRLLADGRYHANPYVMTLAELIVEQHFPGMKRAPVGTAGYDFIDAEGRRVQVKGWGSKNRGFDNIRDASKVDRFIRIFVHDDGWTVLADFLTAPFGTQGPLVAYKTNVVRPVKQADGSKLYERLGEIPSPDAPFGRDETTPLGAVADATRGPLPAEQVEMTKTLRDRVLDVLERQGGYAAIQIAHIVIGPNAVQPQVNEVLRRLCREGLAERRGVGGGNLPFRYYRTSKPRT